MPIIISNELWKEDPLIKDLNSQIKESNKLIALGILIGFIMGIVFGSGIHDFLFHG